MRHKKVVTGYNSLFPAEAYFSHGDHLVDLLGDPDITETYNNPEALIFNGRDIVPYHGEYHNYDDMTIRDWLIERFVKN